MMTPNGHRRSYSESRSLASRRTMTGTGGVVQPDAEAWPYLSEGPSLAHVPFRFERETPAEHSRYCVGCLKCWPEDGDYERESDV